MQKITATIFFEMHISCIKMEKLSIHDVLFTNTYVLLQSFKKYKKILIESMFHVHLS